MSVWAVTPAVIGANSHGSTVEPMSGSCVNLSSADVRVRYGAGWGDWWSSVQIRPPRPFLPHENAFSGLCVLRAEQQREQQAYTADIERRRTCGGLEDRGSRPHRSPRLTPPETVEAIMRTRVEPALGTAPDRAAPRAVPVDRVRRPGAHRLQPTAGRRSPVGRAGPVRPRPPWRAGPPGPQEARPDPDRRQPSPARLLHRDPQAPVQPRLRPLRGCRR